MRILKSPCLGFASIVPERCWTIDENLRKMNADEGQVEKETHAARKKEEREKTR
jgi:hypothetical protein